MPLTPELLARAKSGQRQAITTVVAEYYPHVNRIAHALSGQEACGKVIVTHVIRRSIKAMEKWNHPGDPHRWFIHHTVLASRQKMPNHLDLAADPLIRGVATNSAYYPAFVRALRALPMQQREAYILNHGERLDIRGLSIAMDCSQEAASNHLREATGALSAYGGDFFPTFTAHLAQTYERLAPPEEMVLPAVQATLRRRLSPRTLLGWTVTTLKLLVIGGVIFLSWKILPMLKW
jgi:DNA-directed RNA polymerase specialized sigma24 family protein